jgi:hypothetical protein
MRKMTTEENYYMQKLMELYTSLVSEYTSLVPQVKSPLALSRLLRIYYYAIYAIRG